MPCTPVTFPGGGRGFVCTSRRRQPRCACGAAAPLLCDWKVEGGTCSRPICQSCATSPTPGKDLCQEHAQAWTMWKATRATR